MGDQLTICMQSDLENLKLALEKKGHQVNTNLELRDDTSVYIISNIDEEWEGMGAVQQICFEENKCVLTLNASRLSEDEILSIVDNVAMEKMIERKRDKKIKISLEDGLDDVGLILEQNGYEIVPAYRVDKDVAVMIFSGANGEWEDVRTYQVMQYGESDSLLTLSADGKTPSEILEMVQRVYGKNKNQKN